MHRFFVRLSFLMAMCGLVLLTAHPAAHAATPTAQPTYDFGMFAYIGQPADPLGVCYTVFSGELHLMQTTNDPYKGTFMQYQGRKKYPATGMLNGGNGTLTINF